MKTLRSLKIGETGKIKDIFFAQPMRGRLLELGFAPQTAVTCLSESPLGDPRAYSLRGAIYALRTEDAEKIHIN